MVEEPGASSRFVVHTSDPVLYYNGRREEGADGRGGPAKGGHQTSLGDFARKVEQVVESKKSPIRSTTTSDA